MKLKVLHVFDSLGVGGLEKGVVTLINNASDDVCHNIICMRTSGPMAEKLPQSVSVTEMHKASGNSLSFLCRLSGAIRRISPDVVHTRNWGGMDGIIAARMAGVGSIVHGEHGWDLFDPHGASRKRRLIRRYLSLAVREFVSVSKAIVQWLKNDVRIFRPVTQIYNGVDTDLYRPAANHDYALREFGLPAGTRLIGIVARLDPIKDHETLLRAFCAISAKYHDTHLVIIGDGPGKERLGGWKNDRIHFPGNRMDVPDLMRCLDVFVLPSRNEGISNTILEAMASGVPVVASDVGGSPELVRNGTDGMLFTPGNEAELSHCLELYLEDEGLRRRHGSDARKHVLQQFSIETMVSHYETVWRRVVAAKNG